MAARLARLPQDRRGALAGWPVGGRDRDYVFRGLFGCHPLEVRTMPHIFLVWTTDYTNAEAMMTTRDGAMSTMMTRTEREAVESEVERLVAEIHAGTLPPDALTWRANSKRPVLRMIAALVVARLEAA